MRQNIYGSRLEDNILRNNTFEEGNVFKQGVTIGEGANAAEILGQHLSDVVAVTVPSITDPDIAKVDVDISAAIPDITLKVGDAVQAIPQEALMTNARLQSAYVSAEDTVTLVFGSEGGNVTGAAKNFKFLVTKLVA